MRSVHTIASFLIGTCPSALLPNISAADDRAVFGEVVEGLPLLVIMKGAVEHLDLFA